MRLSKLRLDCDHWLTSKSSMNSNSPFALPPNSDWGLQPETSCCQVPQVHLRKRCCLRRWVQRGACHFLLMLTEDLKYLEILEALSQEQMVLCLLMLWAQDMKDGKGRLICDGIGTLAEADSTLADCLTNKRFHLDARIQIWSNLTAKIWPANASIKSGRIFFPLFFRSDVFDSLFLIADHKCFRYRTKQPMKLFSVILAGAKCPYRNVDDIGGCALQASTYEGDWQNDLQDLQIREKLPKVPITTDSYHLPCVEFGSLAGVSCS